MKQLEENVLQSFKLVKQDIIQLQSELIKIFERQESLFKIIDNIVNKPKSSVVKQVKPKRVTKKKVNKKKVVKKVKKSKK